MSESARSRLVSAVAGVSPLLVLAVTLGGLVVALDRSHAEFAIYVLLFVSTIGLAMSGMSLSRTFFTFPRAWPFLAGVAIVCAGWAWQRYVYVSFVPNHFLEYGYFLKPAGARLRLLLVEGPVAAVAALLFADMIVAAVLSWRSGARASVLLLIAWSFVAFVIFGVPAFGLSIQGEASVFI